MVQCLLRLKCVDMILFGGRKQLSACTTWLLHSKAGECRQGREAFILTLARHSPALLFLRNGLH